MLLLFQKKQQTNCGENLFVNDSRIYSGKFHLKNNRSWLKIKKEKTVNTVSLQKIFFVTLFRQKQRKNDK